MPAKGSALAFLAAALLAITGDAAPVSLRIVQSASLIGQPIARERPAIARGAVPVGAAATITIGSSFRRVDIDGAGMFSIDIDTGKDFKLSFESPGTAAGRHNSSGAAGRCLRIERSDGW